MEFEAFFPHRLDLPPPDQPLDRKAIPAHGGVYAFTDEHNTLIQLIGAQNVRRSACLRLEPPAVERPRKRADIRAVARRLWWTPTYSVFETHYVYWELARRLKPDDYRKQLAFGPVWFARVDPRQRFPRWAVDQQALMPDTTEVGPFETRNACQRFVDMLEDLFDLCRYPHILEQAPHGDACAYSEMGKCPAPCDGSIDLEQYRRMVDASARFAVGHVEQRFGELEADMQHAARELQFERAASLRETINRARNLLRRSGRIVTTPQEFRYLVVQRAERPARIKPFFVDRGSLEAGSSVDLQEVGGVSADWLQRMQKRDDSPVSDSARGSEGIWLVSHFLLKGTKAPGLFLHASELGTPDKVAEGVAARFGSPRDDRSSTPAEPPSR